MIRVET